VEWILNPPGPKGGWMAMVMAVLTLVYLAYAFWKYR